MKMPNSISDTSIFDTAKTRPTISSLSNVAVFLIDLDPGVGGKPSDPGSW